jgi:RNA polymerase sigma-70 factor (ECF subfamily)
VSLSPRTLDESDEDLMRRAQANDPRAFEKLYDRHSARAFRVARHVCVSTTAAEDAMQEGFLSMWRSRATFRPEGGSFGSWAMSIVRNRAVDSVRHAAAGHRPPSGGGEHLGPDPEGGSVEDEVIARGEADDLRAALRRLPDAQSEVITLAFFGALTHSEIARRLSIPEGTVKGRMRLGLDKLRRT